MRVGVTKHWGEGKRPCMLPVKFKCLFRSCAPFGAWLGFRVVTTKHLESASRYQRTLEGKMQKQSSFWTLCPSSYFSSRILSMSLGLP